MSMYPHTGAALINAFNYSLFDTYKSAGWQRLASELCDKYPELDKPMPEDRNFDRSRLTRSDWATQAGMVSRLLREKLSAEDFSILRARYTHDGHDIEYKAISIKLKMTDNLRLALCECWPHLEQALIRQGKVRGSVLSNKTRLQYLSLRALRPDVMERPARAEGAEQQATVNKQQYEVKKAVNELVRSAFENAWRILEEAQLVSAS